MPTPWFEALVAANEDIITCERGFHRQRALIVQRAAEGKDTAKDEILLASYMASLTLVRACRDDLLVDVPAVT